jgi:hypothetical protein
MDKLRSYILKDIFNPISAYLGPGDMDVVFFVSTRMGGENIRKMFPLEFM